MAKKTLTRKIILSILAGAVLLGNSVAWAADLEDTYIKVNASDGAVASANGSGAIAIGDGAAAYKDGIISIGDFSGETTEASANENDISIGYHSGNGSKVDSYTASISIGAGSSANDGGIAFGTNATANAVGSIAIGSTYNITSYYYVEQYNTDPNNIAKTIAQGENAVVIGSAANVIGGENSVAIGAGSWAFLHKNSVALGSDSEVTADYQVSIGGATFDNEGKRNGTFTRSLVGLSNVPDYTDQENYGNYAVNVNTLNAALANVGGGVSSAVTSITSASDGVLTVTTTTLDGDGNSTNTNSEINLNTWADAKYVSNKYFKVNGTGNEAGAFDNDTIAIGVGATAGFDIDDITVSNAIAIGTDASARANNAIVIGTGSDTESSGGIVIGQGIKAFSANGITIGNGAYTASQETVVIGSNAKAPYMGNSNYASNSVVLGANSAANQANTVSVGSAAFTDDKGNEYQAFQRKIVNVADTDIEDEDNAYDAVNVNTLNAALGDYATKQNYLDVCNAVDSVENDIGRIGAHIGVDIYDTDAVANAYGEANNNNGTKYLGSVNTLVEADIALDNAIKANADAIGSINTKVTGSSITKAKYENELLTLVVGEEDAGENGNDIKVTGIASKDAVEANTSKIVGVSRTSYEVSGETKYTTTISDEVVISPIDSNGYFKFKDLGDGTLFYGISNVQGASNPTIVMNAQNGNIETQGSLSVGNGVFVVNAYDDVNTSAKAGDVSMSGSLAVSSNAKIEGVLNVGNDVKAVGDVVASAGGQNVSLLDTAQKVATNANDIATLKNSLTGENGLIDRIDANQNAIEQNKRDIEALDSRVTTNENAIEQNKKDIADNKAAIVKNAQDIATVNTNLVNAIDTINGSIKTVNDNLVTAIDTINGGIGTEVEERKAADVVLQNDIDSEKTAREEADKKLQDNIDKETDERKKTDANLQEQITNIGSGSSEAINGLNQRINKLGTRLNKVGAGAAALAALHPLDFDPDDKLSFSAGVGNYAGENAAALGMFYRPNEKVMLSMGGTMGNGEEMVNMGISFALDKTNNVSNSRVAMAKEINALREHVAKQDEQIAKLVMLVNQLTSNAPQQKAVPAFAKEGRVRVERLSDGYEEYDRVRVVNHKEYGDKAVKAAPQKASK